MANNRIQVKRTNVAGRTANVTSSGNTQFIDAGEFALNMADGILYTSNGSALITVGSNLVNQRITNSLNLDQNKPLTFKTVNTAASVSFIQQNDDNFVFYTTNSTYGQRAVWSIFANNNTANLKFATQTTFNGNLDLNIVAVYANGSPGTAGQVLTTNGTSTYWSTVTGGGSVNTAAQYAWTNTHTFSANVSFTGNGIGITTNTGAIYLGGLADNNWKIGRNTGSVTKWVYTNNTIDIITANSNLEGFVVGLVSNNSYFETGYLGTYIASNVTVGNSTSNLTVNSTAFVVGNSRLLTTNAVFGGSITANGGVGSAGQVLTSGATGNAYWTTPTTGTVTSVGSGNGLTGGPITTTGSLSVLANTGIIANTTGTFVNASYIATISANNSSFLGGVAAASYVQNTDSRTLSGNLNFTGTNTFFTTGWFVGANVYANVTTIFVGNSTVNTTHNSGLYQVSNATSTANVVATGLQVYTNSTVNSTISATTISVANATGNVQAVPTSVTVQNSTVNTVVSLQSVLIQSNTTVNGSITNALVQVANSTGNVQHSATTLLLQTNTTVNSTHTASLVQVANSTSTANLTAADLKIGATTVVNSTQITATLFSGNIAGGYANITGQVNTSTLYAATSANIASVVQANSLGIFTTATANAQNFTAGAGFGAATVGATVNSGTIGISSNTTVNSSVTSSLLQTANSTGNVQHSATSILAQTNTTVNGSLTASLVQVANSTGNVQAVPTSVTVQNSTVNAVVGLQSLIIQSNTTVNGSITNSLVQVANSTGNLQASATTLLVQTNTTVNASMTSSLVRVANATGSANLTATSLIIGNTTIQTTNTILGGTLAANGGVGSAGQALISGGAANAYWTTIGNGTVTSVASGNGITGGTITSTGTLVAVAGAGVVVNTSGINVLANNGITSNSTGTFARAANGISVDASGINVTGGNGLTVNSTGVHVLANTGIIANTTGTFVNANYIATISANNASFLGGVAAASYVQNTDSRTLSGNLVFTGANLFFQSGSLGGTSTNFVNNFIINTNVGNASYLRFYHYRHTTGGDWTGVSTRLQQRIDATDMGYIEFNPSGYTYGMGLYGSSGYGLTISQTGQSTFGNTVILGTVGVSANGSTGTSGQVLTTNGTSAYWSTVASGGSANSTGGTGALQYYNGSTFGSSANLLFDGTSLSVGNSTVNSVANLTAVTAHIQHASRPTLGFNYTVANTVNSLIVGPYQVNTGFTLTVETGARLVIA